MKLQEAIKVLSEALIADENYRRTWVANIAVQFQDGWQRSVDESGLPCTSAHIHKISNSAAEKFINILTMDSA